MIIGLLGVLKSGGAYVPLDPDYPAERLRFMLENSGTEILLSQTSLRDRLPKFSGKTIDLDLQKNIEMYPAHDPERRSCPENLAYVIYTSGSTGTPKGVMIEHQALTNFLSDMGHRTALLPIDHLLALTTLSFDIATLELYLPLSIGACVDLITRQTATDAEQLKAAIQDSSITAAQATPATWKMLLDSGWQQTQPLTVLCGGEAISPELGRQLSENSEQLWNVYGPTETTVWSTAHNITDNPDHPTYIGRPIANTRIYLLDRNNQIQPVGVPGELCIAGDGLARGYLNRPELTAEKFIEIKLFGKTERIYRTGDLARWKPDGTLEYLGRIDHQVKLRGFRIELGEIETALTQHEAVSEAVVVPHEREGNKSLAAYITETNALKMEDEPSSADLRGFLKETLPDYMIPASFTVLERLPLTPNGKIDRKALPEPNLSESGEITAPRTETEMMLAALWSDVLKFEVTNVTTHFFEVGGHSLLATRLASRIRDTFEVDLPLRSIFEYPVLANLAECLDGQRRGEAPPPIEPRPDSAPLTISHAQHRLWFLSRLEGKSATYNMPSAVRLTGKLDINALGKTFAILTERHQSLRMQFPEIDGEATIQLIPPYTPLTVTDLSHLSKNEQEHELHRRIRNHMDRPFDIAEGPLLRLNLLILGQQEHALLINIHHIISDGWSMDVLKREWMNIYAALSKEEKPELKPLPIQYADYAAWQKKHLSGELLDNQLEWWMKQLDGAPPLLELPVDHARPAVRSPCGAHLRSRINQQLTGKLRKIGHKREATLFMTLLTAFNVLLRRHSGQNDISIGTPIANRTDNRTEELIGFFVNTLVFRTRFEDKISFMDLLGQTRSTALGAYARQDVPFEQLVERLSPERSLSHNPLFQVMFILQNNEDAELSLPGLKIEPLEQNLSMAKFDLTLSVDESDDGLLLTWEYTTDLFEASTVQCMADHFVILLEKITQNPEDDIDTLPLLTEAETNQLIEWNRTAEEYPKDKTLVDLLEEQAEQKPDNIAVIFKEQPPPPQ
ncbi:MAG: amino acid adenylation domain-containing protein, partial [Candidatus Electrothrix sp. AR4]|nr:amino acid adenylation domain-containing protein [Candidatus Electrothrix sp. AR4]